MIKKTPILQLFVCVILGCACTHSGKIDQDPNNKQSSIRNFAKGDIDSVLDIHVYQLRQLLRQLMIKLYKRNPIQLKYSPFPSIEKNVLRVFEEHHDWKFKQLDHKTGIDAIQMALDQNYKGDRVFSFIVGLSSMLMQSYGNKIDFYMLDTVDSQALYNSARNIEIAVWKLSHNKDENGKPFLYSNSLADEQYNLSYERLFGQLIAIQDSTAKIMADKDKRIIKKIFIRLSSILFFLPI